MTIKIYRPESLLLKKYIECFYILEKTDEEKATAYFTFPSIYTIVTISEQTQTMVSPNKVITKHFPSNSIETNLVCNFNEPVLVCYEGKINEITTYFKPLGINAFIPNDLSDYNSGTFPDFNPHLDYKDAMRSILSIDDQDGRIKALEHYWISKFWTFKNALLENIITEMLDTSNVNQSMSEFSLKTRRSRTTINKQFDQHICPPPPNSKKSSDFELQFKATSKIETK